MTGQWDKNAAMFRRISATRFGKFTIALILVIGIGYLSNLMALSACRTHTQQRLGERLSKNQISIPPGRVESGPATAYFPWIVAVRYAYIPVSDRS